MSYLIKRFAYFCLFIASFVVLLLGIYIYQDPFHVLRKYDSYSFPDYAYNMDYIAVQNLINKNPKYNYNSFIFGSSRALMGFRPSDWKKYITTDSTRISNLSCFNECIYGIHKKIVFIDKNQNKIDNVLLTFCPDFGFGYDSNAEGFLYRKHYATTGENYFEFQKYFFDAFTTSNYLSRSLLYAITKNKNHLKSIGTLDSISINPITNEYRNLTWESGIKKDSVVFFADRIPPKRDSMAAYKLEPLINDGMKKKLEEIKSIFIKHKTQYKVVICPNYYFVKLHQTDLVYLKQLFGTNFYDFSGINEYDINPYDFYDGSHFRYYIGDSIMSKIYKPKI